MKKVCNSFTFFMGIALLCLLSATPAFAATRKCYTISSGNTPVYSNSGLTRSYGTIYGSDEVTVHNVTSSYSYVSYPTSRGSKTGYIRTSAILWGTSGKTYTATGKFTTYRRPGGYSYGYVANRDSVVVLGQSNGYVQIKYPTGSGYKYAFCYSSDANRYLSGFGGSSSSTYYVTTTAGLILRSGPSTGYSKITTMPYGSAIQVSSISGGWAKCTYNGRSGYCSSSYISTSKPSGGSGGSYSALSQALYKNSGAYISCGFDGYTTTSGRHEGIDMVLRLNAPVYALVSGTVTRVSYGYNGTYGLSTVAIYDSSANKTVVYLHMNPVSLRVGQSISKGQQIGTQGWRGVSSSNGSHTHVEVRNGKQTAAAKSLYDYRLDNPNPTSYWNSKGYSVR